MLTSIQITFPTLLDEMLDYLFNRSIAKNEKLCVKLLAGAGLFTKNV